MDKSEIWITAVFIVGWFLQLIKAEKLNCTVRQNGNLMSYTITDSRAPDGNAFVCDFLWINGSDFTIADNFSQIPPVVNSSINSLTTSQCLEGIICKHHCISKATMVDYIANCTVTCNGKDFNHREEDGPSKIWLAVVPICVIVLVVFALCLMFWKKKWRTSIYSQCGGLYMKVKMKNIDPKLPEV
ncbi:hypothetical protein XENORESO_013562 [Xenotaenia resolanae]|uniref:Uncharacterized protein n=1 Tax=Xenotaenia resolanae TaxID=208358 RepID=A0ABV0WAZ9_9TELE